MSEPFKTSSTSLRRNASGVIALIPHLCLSVFICGSAAHAQQRSSLYGKESLQGVYVRDSAIAVEKLALAERLERLKEWNKSAEVYQEIIEQYPDRVVPSRVDDENQIVQYSSVVSAVQERLAKWPQEGLAVYRNRYETSAQALLDAAPPDDPQALHRVANLFFVTDTARQSALRLIDLQLQNGEFAAAAWLGDRLLQWHPNLDIERPVVLYRTAIAYRLVGNTDAAAARLAELAEKHADAAGIIRGSEVRLADSLRVELASEAALQTAAADSWPTAFGNLSRDRVPTVSGASGARLFSVPINRSVSRVPAGMNRQQLNEIDRADREKGFATGILPVIDNGELFFQDNARVYAVSLDSGLPLPGWAETYGGDRGGRYAVPGAWPTPLGTQMAVTVTTDAVFAVLAQSDPRTVLYTGGGTRESRLVCLDRATGRERWSFASRGLADDRNAGRSMELTGTPLVAGDRVFVCAQSGAGVQFQKCEVIALDVATGRIAWRSYVASASNTIQPWDLDSSMEDDSTPQISYADGRIYVNSNLGAAAALDGYDGTVIWLNLYPRDLPEFNRMFQAGRFNRANNATRTRPWAHNPLIINGNRVFMLPRNCDFAFIYDASTGAEISRIPLRPFDEADTLVGVMGEKLVIGSPKTISCIDWKRFKPDAPLDDYQLWRKVFEKSEYDDASIRGRTFLTSDSVFVPLGWRITRVKLSSGAAISSYPADGREWAEEEGPGNLLVTQDHLVIAGSDRVAVYTDLSLAMRKLDAEVAADPQSPLPRLRYAEVMFVAGKYDVAAAKLDEAADLLGGKNALQLGTARDRLFNSSVNFARRLMVSDAGAAAVVDGFFDRAATAAANPQQQVVYRVARSRWAKQQKNDAAELALYQEILSDPNLRVEPVTTGDGGSNTSAAYFAQREIAALISRNPKVYAPIEQKAQEELDAVAGSGDADKLLGVAQTYPNSQVASRALQSAAEAYESAGNSKTAVSVLRTLLARNLPTASRVGCLEALARNYLALPNRLEVASSRLAQAADLAPAAKLARAITLPDGRTLENVAFADAAAAIKQARREMSRQKLPRVPLPPAAEGGTAPPPALVEVMEPIDAVSRLLRPGGENPRFDRVVAYVNNAVSVFEVGKTSPLFTSTSTDAAVGCTWVGNNLLYWTAGRIVFCKGDDSGESMWEISIADLPPVEVTPADAEDAVADDSTQPEVAMVRRRNQEQIIIQQARLRGRMNVRMINGRIVQQPAAPAAPDLAGNEQIVHAHCLSDRVIVSTNQGRIIALDLSDGQPLWQSRPTDRTMERLLANEDFIATMFYDELSAQIAAVDTASGQLVFRRVFSREGLSPVNLALAPDGKLIYLMPETLVCKDLFDPSSEATYSRTVRSSEGAQVFGTEPRQSSQLLIADDRIIALTDNGQFVRLFALENGEPITTESAELRQTIERKLRTGASDWNVRLMLVGPRLYAMGLYTLLANNVEQSEPALTFHRENQDRFIAREIVATPTHLLRFEESNNRTERRRDRASGLRIAAFSRATNEKGEESGRIHHVFMLGAPNIVAHQVVDGGVYYLTQDREDRKLHFLAGAGK